MALLRQFLNLLKQDTALTWNTLSPRLTECFMNIALIWAPCLLLALFSLVDVHFRRKSRYADIPWSFLNVSKTLVIALLIVLSTTDLVMMLNTKSTVYSVQIVTTAVKIVAFVSRHHHSLVYDFNLTSALLKTLVAFLQQYHKHKGHRTSGLLFNFWLLLTVCAIPELLFTLFEVRERATQWATFQYASYIAYFSVVCLMLVLNCFADKAPRRTTYRNYDNPSPELQASFLRQIFFQWFDKTTWRGWRGPLTERDIFDINPDDASCELVPPFDKYFNESVEKGRR
jgi:ATP-binding cassette subfamily C (CFTR/MRP) protein 1